MSTGFIYVYIQIVFCGFDNNETTIWCVCRRYDMIWYDVMWRDVIRELSFDDGGAKGNETEKSVFTTQCIFCCLPRECSFQHTHKACFRTLHVHSHSLPPPHLSLDTINRVFLGKICIFRRLIHLISPGMTPMIHICEMSTLTHSHTPYTNTQTTCKLYNVCMGIRCVPKSDGKWTKTERAKEMWEIHQILKSGIIFIWCVMCATTVIINVCTYVCMHVRVWAASL